MEHDAGQGIAKSISDSCHRSESRGKIIAEHQMVQEKIADSYASIQMLRLFVLETAWKIDNSSTQDTRTDIAAVKYSMAKMEHDVSGGFCVCLLMVHSDSQRNWSTGPASGSLYRFHRGLQ